MESSLRTRSWPPINTPENVGTDRDRKNPPVKVTHRITADNRLPLSVTRHHLQRRTDSSPVSGRTPAWQRRTTPLRVTV
jgi:hypothetical protein